MHLSKYFSSAIIYLLRYIKGPITYILQLKPIYVITLIEVLHLAGVLMALGAYLDAFFQFNLYKKFQK